MDNVRDLMYEYVRDLLTDYGIVGAEEALSGRTVVKRLWDVFAGCFGVVSRGKELAAQRKRPILWIFCGEYYTPKRYLHSKHL